jgi:cupin fold WbuC family metalloprotein
MIRITKELINEVSEKAKSSARKRSNYNFHESYDDPVQRFLNAVEPDSYLQPHKHENPDKTEIFLILRGRVLIVEFDETGKIADHFVLDSRVGNVGVEIPPRTWHSFIALQKGSILFEIKEGPFRQETGKTSASWAPEEGTREANEFNKRILRELNLQICGS